MKAEKKTFQDKTIQLDGSEFRYCHFERCRLTYDGGKLPTLEGNSMINCDWHFTGAAARTAQFMNALAKQGGSARDLIEKTVFSDVPRFDS